VRSGNTSLSAPGRGEPFDVLGQDDGQWLGDRDSAASRVRLNPPDHLAPRRTPSDVLDHGYRCSHRVT
jgi:hypothetical protein